MRACWSTSLPPADPSCVACARLCMPVLARWLTGRNPRRAPSQRRERRPGRCALAAAATSTVVRSPCARDGGVVVRCAGGGSPPAVCRLSGPAFAFWPFARGRSARPKRGRPCTGSATSVRAACWRRWPEAGTSTNVPADTLAVVRLGNFPQPSGVLQPASSIRPHWGSDSGLELQSRPPSRSFAEGVDRQMEELGRLMSTALQSRRQAKVRPSGKSDDRAR